VFEPNYTRRRFIRSLGVAAFALTPSAWSDERLRTPWQTAGPFYPDRFPADTDNDLIVVDGRRVPAAGQVTHLSGRIIDVRGHAMAATVVEIWQVDSNGVYLHGADRHAKRDAGFQGYGRFVTGPSGEYFFRTIKPVPYPGRTPHIHFKVTPKGRPAFTTQCYVKGEPLNATDAVLNSVSDTNARAALIVPFSQISGSNGGELSARFDIVLA